ncbi:MAG: magnesium/cobalt transporter CorA [Gammaproteobacteria bacterium]|nr:magnesium/cobalt transporter CorA [Gammaproteobacteria bacterium]
MLRAFNLSGGRLVELGGGEPTPQQLRNAAWIDLQEPTEAERGAVDVLYPASLPDADDVEEIEASARYFADKQGIHVHSSFLYQSEGRHKIATVAFTLQPDQLLTLRDVELADFRLYRMRARRAQVEAASPTSILTSIFDLKVENLADFLEDLHGQLERVSQMVLQDVSANMEDAIDELAKLEDSNGKIRLCLMDTQRSLLFLIRQIREHPGEVDTCRDVLRDLDTLMSHTTYLFDKVNFLMDAAQGFINIEQNRIIKIFSIVAVVLLPPTLVASIYGMNFRLMPELDWLLGYPMALGLMVLAALAPYWYFKRKGWL